MLKPHHIAAACLFAPLATAQQLQHTVAPAAYATSDAVSLNWIAGASSDIRQQLLVDESHLTAMVGKTVHALEFRRTADAETFSGGKCDLSLRLSIAPHPAVESRSRFADNVGAGAVLVYDDEVVFPQSPGTSSPNVGWTTDNVVRVAFSTPFVYTGGTLCVDLTGTTVGGFEANWWMADAECLGLSGQTTDLGGGCGAYGDHWSHVNPRSLLAGGYAQMFAHGTPGGLGLVVIGDASPQPIPLALLGFTPPGVCNIRLQTILLAEGLVFVPDSDPALAARGGRADLELRIPALTGVLGVTLTTQWLDLFQQATSNAIEWRTASTISDLGMALVEGAEGADRGDVTVDLAHVLRFEYQ